MALLAEVKALCPSPNLRGRGFDSLALSFHFLFKLPPLYTPISFGLNLIKDTFFAKPIFEG